MENGQRELDYLKELNRKYSRYLKQYFGFNLKEISLKAGINPTLFIMILKGQRPMPPKHIEQFIRVFREMDIEAKTINFQETNLQKIGRSLRKKIILDKNRV